MKLQANEKYNAKNSIAEDMFSPDLLQVFQRKTGKYLGYIKAGENPDSLQAELFAEPEEAPKEATDPNQISLF